MLLDPFMKFLDLDENVVNLILFILTALYMDPIYVIGICNITTSVVATTHCDCNNNHSYCYICIYCSRYSRHAFNLNSSDVNIFK